MTKSKYNLNLAICRYMLINVNIKKITILMQFWVKVPKGGWVIGVFRHFDSYIVAGYHSLGVS
jgi:hypothetical protein